eukprot:scaffold2699_cov98-Isochrysis_galbana.AAC.6
MWVIVHCLPVWSFREPSCVTGIPIARPCRAATADPAAAHMRHRVRKCVCRPLRGPVRRMHLQESG